MIISFIQDSADKHIPPKTSRTVSSVPWITSETRRKIRRRNKTHAKVKKTGSKKLRSKSETLRKEIKDDVRKQHDLYVNNLVGGKANPRDFCRYINSQKKDNQGIPEELVSRLQKLNRLRNLMVSLRMCSPGVITVRSHCSVGRPLSWMTLLFQTRV